MPVIRPLQDPKIVQKRYRDQFFRRKRSLFKNAHDFHMTFSAAEVYVCLHHNNKFYVYTSTTNHYWPPPLTEISNMYPLPVIQTPEDLGPLPASRQAVLERSVFLRGGPKMNLKGDGHMDGSDVVGNEGQGGGIAPTLQDATPSESAANPGSIAALAASGPALAGRPHIAAASATGAGPQRPFMAPWHGHDEERQLRNRGAACRGRVQKPSTRGGLRRR